MGSVHSLKFSTYDNNNSREIPVSHCQCVIEQRFFEPQTQKVNQTCTVPNKTTTTKKFTMSLSKIRINFHPNSEALINKQINMELHASYVYMSMADYFDRDDVALHGFAKRFRENSDEEREHAQKFIDYQNRRGGRVVFQDVAKPRTDEWGSALAAVEASFELEKKV